VARLHWLHDPQQIHRTHPVSASFLHAMQDEMFETPMQPITMLRNSLGRQEGGSGVPINRDAYEKSVMYWDSHATIVDGPKPNGE